ncbi:MAG: hypothetical protein QM770_15390 [Tepidisphaeraceae bacterium]
MITLTCSNCGQTLEVDDGFAGGVCRCNHCAAIQTVPAAGAATAGSGRTLYQKRSRVSATDLDALSDIVTSSGLSGVGTGLSSGGRSARSKSKKNRLPLLIVGAVGLVAVSLGLGIWLGRGTSPQSNDAKADSKPATPAATHLSPRDNAPSFASIDLTSETVIYVLDRGDATAEFLPSLQKAVARSAKSLGGTRRFQFIYWTSGDETPTFPTTPRPATAPEVAQALTAMSTKIAGSRATELLPALERAMRESPGDIVIATAKGNQLDDEVIEAVTKLTAGKQTHIHTIDLYHPSDEPAEPLQRLAKANRGVFLRVSPDDLTGLAE